MGGIRKERSRTGSCPAVDGCQVRGLAAMTKSSGVSSLALNGE